MSLFLCAYYIYLMIKENHDENVALREVSLKIIPQENLNNSQECFGEQDLKHWPKKSLMEIS